MSPLPPPPSGEPVPAVFRGGVRRRSELGWGSSWPLGHLEITADRLHLWRHGDHRSVAPDEVHAVRLSRGILASRVSVILADGTESDAYVSVSDRSGVRRALQLHGWPVVEDRSLRRWRGGPP